MGSGVGIGFPVAFALDHLTVCLLSARRVIAREVLG